MSGDTELKTKLAQAQNSLGVVRKENQRIRDFTESVLVLRAAAIERDVSEFCNLLNDIWPDADLELAVASVVTDGLFDGCKILIAQIEQWATDVGYREAMSSRTE